MSLIQNNQNNHNLSRFNSETDHENMLRQDNYDASVKLSALKGNEKCQGNSSTVNKDHETSKGLERCQSNSNLQTSQRYYSSSDLQSVINPIIESPPRDSARDTRCHSLKVGLSQDADPCSRNGIKTQHVSSSSQGISRPDEDELISFMLCVPSVVSDRMEEGKGAGDEWTGSVLTIPEVSTEPQASIVSVSLRRSLANGIKLHSPSKEEPGNEVKLYHYGNILWCLL